MEHVGVNNSVSEGRRAVARVAHRGRRVVAHQAGAPSLPPANGGTCSGIKNDAICLRAARNERVSGKRGTKSENGVRKIMKKNNQL